MPVDLCSKFEQPSRYTAVPLHKGDLSIYSTRSYNSYEHMRQMKYSLNDTHY